MTEPMRTIPTLPLPTTRAKAIERALVIAASQVGYREGKRGDDWNNDNAFGKWYGYNGVAWCAQFVSWVFGTAGYLDVIVPRHQYTPSGWSWFAGRNQDVSTPAAGDLVYVYGYVAAEGRSRVHHVGIVEKVLPRGYIQTIEGNTNDSGSSQGNGVYRLTRLVTSRLRFARPDYDQVVTAWDGSFKQDAQGFPLSSAGKRCMSYDALIYAGQHRNMSGLWAAYRRAAMASLRTMKTIPADMPDDQFPEAWVDLETRIGRAVPNTIPDQYSFGYFIGRTGYVPPDSGTTQTSYNDWP